MKITNYYELKVTVKLSIYFDVNRCEYVIIINNFLCSVIFFEKIMNMHIVKSTIMIFLLFTVSTLDFANFIEDQKIYN